MILRIIPFLFLFLGPPLANGTLVDFDTTRLKGDRQITNPHVHRDVTFSVVGASLGDEVVGLVRNSATAACVGWADGNQTLGTGRSSQPDGGIGLSGFGIRADFSPLASAPVEVGVWFQTVEGTPIRVRLFSSHGTLLAEEERYAHVFVPLSYSPSDCGIPGDKRVPVFVSVSSASPVAYAIMDLGEETGREVFVIDDFEVRSAATKGVLNLSLSDYSIHFDDEVVISGQLIDLFGAGDPFDETVVLTIFAPDGRFLKTDLYPAADGWFYLGPVGGIFSQQGTYTFKAENNSPDLGYIEAAAQPLAVTGDIPLLGPINGATVNTTTVFRWDPPAPQSDPAAASARARARYDYTLVVADDPNMSSESEVLRMEGLTAHSTVVTGLPPGRDLYWKVIETFSGYSSGIVEFATLSKPPLVAIIEGVIHTNQATTAIANARVAHNLNARPTADGLWITNSEGKYALVIPTSLAKPTIKLHAHRCGYADTTDEVDFPGADSRGRNLPLTPLSGSATHVRQLRNISTNGYVDATGMIAGFILSQSARIAVVGEGEPTSTSSLGDPILELSRLGQQSTPFAQNDDWASSPNASEFRAIIGRTINGPKDAGIIQDGLSPGAYLATLKGYGGTTGRGIVAVNQDMSGSTGLSLQNISTNAYVGTDGLVAGFIVEGPGRYAITAEGVGDAATILSNPKLRVIHYPSFELIAENEDWRMDPEWKDVREIINRDLDRPQDAGLALSLDKGAYLAEMKGVGGTTGRGLISVMQGCTDDARD